MRNNHDDSGASISRLENIAAEAAMVLTGFDAGVFVRSTDRDHESGWAIRLLPYIGALARLKHLIDSTELLASAPAKEPE